MERKWKDFDFGRANTLMSTIVEAGKHGPLYQEIAAMASEDLKAMIEEAKGQKPEAVRTVEQANRTNAPKPTPSPVPIQPNRIGEDPKVNAHVDPSVRRP